MDLYYHCFIISLTSSDYLKALSQVQISILCKSYNWHPRGRTIHLAKKVSAKQKKLPWGSQSCTPDTIMLNLDSAQTLPNSISVPCNDVKHDAIQDDSSPYPSPPRRSALRSSQSCRSVLRGSSTSLTAPMPMSPPIAGIASPSLSQKRRARFASQSSGQKSNESRQGTLRESTSRLLDLNVKPLSNFVWQ